MATKIIVSYDGTENDTDALALGRLLARAGGSLALAYVRHALEPEPGREKLAQHEAEELLATGARWLGEPDVPRHVVLSGSTPEGLRDLAERDGADLIVFGSEYRTAPGHVQPGSSALHLLEGGPIAISLAPAGLRDRADLTVETIAAVGEDGDPGPKETAASLAGRARRDRRPPRRRDGRPRRRRLEARNGRRPRHSQRRGAVPDRDAPLPRARPAARGRNPLLADRT